MVRTLRLDSDLARNLLQLLDPQTHWYLKWYFDIRFEEEMLRSVRHGHELSVIVLSVQEIAEWPDDQKEDFSLLLAYVANSRLRATDLAGRLGKGAYAVALPQTGSTGAHLIATRIAEDLADYLIGYEIKQFPQDGILPADLLRLSAPQDNILDISRYRRREP